MIPRWAYALIALAFLVGAASPASAHALPAAGDHFSYTESVVLDGGFGNYTGYNEGTFINGSLSVAAVTPSTIETANYQSETHYANNQGQSQSFPSAGTFTFSASTFHYVNGTDNQSGYVNPYVWFYVDSSLAPSGTFYLLNSQLTLRSTTTPFALSSSPTGYVATLYGDGTGAFERNDGYGVFSATYEWQAYFDPGTGYIVGYLYTEHDDDGAGDGFTWTDALSVTSTSYALTPATAPPPPPPPSASLALVAVLPLLLLIGLVVLIVVVVVVVAGRNRSAMPRHSVQGTVQYSAPAYPGPAPLNFGVPDQPSVQQIVIKETVKVNCRYCGTLIDTTATVCPKCGAPRT